MKPPLDPRLEPVFLLRAFAGRILESLQVAVAIEMSPGLHPHRYAELVARLSLMARAGWLCEEVGTDGTPRYCPTHSAGTLTLPPEAIALLERAVVALEEMRPPKRDTARAVDEIAETLTRQLPQGIDNAARHIAACLEDYGR
jgi:hypothetical protein